MKKKTILASLLVLPWIFSPVNVVFSGEEEELRSTSERLTRETETTFGQVNQTYQERKELEEQITKLRQEIPALEAEIQGAKRKVSERKVAASRQLQWLQENGTYQVDITVLMSATSISGFLHSLLSLTKIRQEQTDKISELGEAREKKERLMKEKTQKLTELERQQAELVVRSQQLEAQIAELKNQSEKSQARLEELSKAKIGVPANLSPSAASGKSFVANATAYSCQAPGMGTRGSYGVSLLENPHQVAVDPSVIPLGSLVEVEGYGIAIAGDTGGAIKGDHIDVHFPTNAEACAWGRKFVKITVL